MAIQKILNFRRFFLDRHGCSRGLAMTMTGFVNNLSGGRLDVALGLAMAALSCSSWRGAAATKPSRKACR